MDYDSLIEIMRRYKYDDHKISTLANYVKNLYSIPHEEMCSIINLLTYDSGKSEALSLFSDRFTLIMNSDEMLCQLLNLFTYDDAKIKWATKFISNIPQLIAVKQCFTYESSYNQLLQNPKFYSNAKECVVERIEERVEIDQEEEYVNIE
jgi:hypothetical protein